MTSSTQRIFEKGRNIDRRVWDGLVGVYVIPQLHLLVYSEYRQAYLSLPSVFQYGRNCADMCSRNQLFFWPAAQQMRPRGPDISLSIQGIYQSRRHRLSRWRFAEKKFFFFFTDILRRIRQNPAKSSLPISDGGYTTLPRSRAPRRFPRQNRKCDDVVSVFASFLRGEDIVSSNRRGFPVTRPCAPQDDEDTRRSESDRYLPHIPLDIDF